MKMMIMMTIYKILYRLIHWRQTNGSVKIKPTKNGWITLITLAWRCLQKPNVEKYQYNVIYWFFRLYTHTHTRARTHTHTHTHTHIYIYIYVWLWLIDWLIDWLIFFIKARSIKCQCPCFLINSRTNIYFLKIEIFISCEWNLKMVRNFKHNIKCLLIYVIISFLHYDFTLLLTSVSFA